MARINDRPSSTPVQRSSSSAALSPSPPLSDQENRDPSSERRVDKGKRAMPPPAARIPTPISNRSGNPSSNKKRKRPSARAVSEQPSDIEEDGEEAEDDEFTKHYDPNQDPDKRRQVKKQSRKLEREFHENKDEFLKSDNAALISFVHRADGVYSQVRQTADATVDSRLLVDLSDVGYKKSAQLVLGDTSMGVDVDEFLSKAITYMRNGGPQYDDDEAGPSRSQRRRTQRGGGDDSEDDADDDFATAALDWAHFGTHACFPFNSRPPVPGFLLGPLSVEKKIRTQTQRRARQVRGTGGREERPEALTKDDLEQNENSGLTAICTRIRSQLVKFCKQGTAAIQRAGIEDLGSEQGKALLRKHRMSSTGGIRLFDFVINPYSFGQTVENLFYTSFLIKEGSAGVELDEDEMPFLQAAIPATIEEQRARKISKHQAIFAIDFDTWKTLTKAFDMTESMIPHRDEEQPTQVGARGWYG